MLTSMHAWPILRKAKKKQKEGRSKVSVSCWIYIIIEEFADENGEGAVDFIVARDEFGE